MDPDKFLRLLVTFGKLGFLHCQTDKKIVYGLANVLRSPNGDLV